MLDPIDLLLDYDWFTHSDRAFDRGRRVAAEGRQVEGIVTGLRYTSKDDLTDSDHRVEWPDPDAARTLVARVRYGAEVPDCVRLGATAPLRVDDGLAVLDGAVLGVDIVGRPSRRRVVEPGLDDRRMDWSVRRRIGKWPHERGVLVTAERTVVLGIATENWDLTVRRADGSTVVIERSMVPAYARRVVVVGGEVEIAVQPGGKRAEVDVAAMVIARAGGSWRDPVPPSSIAALRAATGGTPSVSDLDTGGSPEPADHDDGPGPPGATEVEGVTVEQFARIEVALRAERVPVEQHDAFATERFGVAPGRWGAIRHVWETQTRSDWRDGAAFGAAVQQAKKEIKRRR